MQNLTVGQEITVTWNSQIFNTPAIVSSVKGSIGSYLGQFVVARLLKPVDLGRGYPQRTVCVRYGATQPNNSNWVTNEAYA